MQNEWNDSPNGSEETIGPLGRDNSIRDESSTWGQSSILSMVSIFWSTVVANSDICEKSLIRSLCCRRRLEGVIIGELGVAIDGVDCVESMATRLKESVVNHSSAEEVICFSVNHSLNLKWSPID